MLKKHIQSEETIQLFFNELIFFNYGISQLWILFLYFNLINFNLIPNNNLFL